MEDQNEKGQRTRPGPEDEEKKRDAIREIAEALIDGEISSREQLQSFKLEVSKRLRLKALPTNSSILARIRDLKGQPEGSLLGLLIKKPSRTLSGVAVVAVMTSPHDCPHGKCSFCPGGTSKEVPTPQSYTGREPAAMRAAMNEYDPYKQTLNRITQLEEIGHSTDKIDLILMGGTITARDLSYQTSFVKGCLDAMNGKRSADLAEAQFLNETSPHRCIGMTFETRPDQFSEEQCRNVLELGGTRVELGVQSTFDGPLNFCSRGHGVDESVRATGLAKDAGLKVGYHMMPGLPTSDHRKDVESSRRVFEEPRFRPDMIKLYPVLVVKGTELYDQWKRGEYEPLDTRKAANIVAEIKRITPPWIRIQRVQRDIPTPVIEAGVKMSNLRQVAGEIMEEKGWKCRCIRCREVGHREREGVVIPPLEDFKVVRREYDASGGREYFLSIEEETTDTLLGYIRARDPSPSSPWEASVDSLMVRELKVFGRMASLGRRDPGTWQHKGTGRKLLAIAEELAYDELGKDKVIVTSGIGVREYYRSLGYSGYLTYMSRDLD